MTASRPIRLVAVGGSGVGLRFEVGVPPGSGETALAHDVRIINGGKAANQAIGAAFLGAQASLVSAVGRDPFANIVRGLLSSHDVSTHGLIELAGDATMVGVVMVDARGENRITLAPGALARITATDVQALSELISTADVCVVSLEIALGAAVEALRIARAAGVPAILDPSPVPSSKALGALLPLADWITPNAGEARQMTGSEHTPEDAAAMLLQRGARGVVITLGPDGALVADDSPARRVPSQPVMPEEMVDTSGAGDAFSTVFALVLATGRRVDEAAAWGCEAGSRICRGPGFVEALDAWQGLAGDASVA